MTFKDDYSSLYGITAVPSSETAGREEPDEIPPGTSLTASVETIDNDRTSLMLDANVVR